MSDTVKFNQMKDGTRADYELLRQHEEQFFAGTAERLLGELARQADETISGYKVTRLQHALQTASRAEDDGADIDWIVAALLHDIGDGLAPQNHDRFAAEIMRPFLREEVTWVVEHHGLFQMIYYAHHYGWDPDRREEHRDHPCYQSCVDFCERWDQASFDADFPMRPLEHFAPLVHEVYARKAWDEAHVKPGMVTGLPVI